MANKYKAIILALIGAAVLGALFLPGLDWISRSGEEGNTAEDAAEVSLEAFAPTNNSFMEYNQARADGKPIVLEFYARW
jgi:thiol:disulfide interchange protein